MAVYAIESWSGANGAVWPSQWTLTLASGASSSIQGNRGRLVTPAAGTFGTAVARLTGMPSTTTDQDLTATVYPPAIAAGAEAYTMFRVRDNGVVGSNAWEPQTGYMLWVVQKTDGTRTVDIWRYLNGVGTLVAGGLILPGGWPAAGFKIRFQAVGTTIRAKVWDAVSAEPASWTLSGTDSAVASGRAALVAVKGSQTTVLNFDFDDVVVTDGVSVVATETWLGTTGAAWPSVWIPPSTQASGTTTIQANKGRIAPAANYAGRSMYLNIATAAEQDYTVLYRLSAVTETFGCFAIRSGTTSVVGDAVTPAVGYMFVLFTDTGSTLITGYRNNVAFASDVSPGFALVANTDYKVRVQAIGSIVRFKVWLASAVEPAAWSVTYTDPSPLGAGRMWLAAQTGVAAKTFDFDDLVVTDNVVPALAAVPFVRTAGPSGSGTLSATTIARPIVQVSDDGSGTLTAAIVPRFTAQVNDDGSGTLTATAVARPISQAAVSGSGTLTATTVARPISQANEDGSGTLTAATVVRLTVQADEDGSGTLSATTVARPISQAALSGSGMLTASATAVKVSTQADETGSGTLTATTAARPISSVAVSGSGTLTATVLQASSVAAAVSGSGTLTATSLARPVIQAALNGSGTASTFTSPSITIATTPSGSGSLTAGTSAQGQQSVSLSGTGTLTAQTVPRFSAAAGQTGSATLSAQANSRKIVDASLSGVGYLTATSSSQGSSSVDIGGSGELTATSTARITVPAAFGGSGTITTTRQVSVSRSAAFTGSGQLTAATGVSGSQPAGFQGSGSLTATVSSRLTVARSLSGSGALSATSRPKFSLNANLHGDGHLSGANRAVASPRHTIGEASIEELVGLAGEFPDTIGGAVVDFEAVLATPIAELVGATIVAPPIGYAELLSSDVSSAVLDNRTELATVET